MCLYKQKNVNGLSLYTVYYAIEQCSTINPIMLNIILQIMLTGNVTLSRFMLYEGSAGDIKPY